MESGLPRPSRAERVSPPLPPILEVCRMSHFVGEGWGGGRTGPPSSRIPLFVGISNFDGLVLDDYWELEVKLGI